MIEIIKEPFIVLAGGRIHASFLINNGRTLYEVRRLLGHSQIKTTQRYAHLSPEKLLAASNAASCAIADLTGALPKAEANRPVVSVRR